MDKEKFSEYKRSFAQIITKMKDINPSTFDIEKAQNDFSNLLDRFEELYDEYQNNYVELMLDNNELYSDYNEILSQITNEKNKRIEILNQTEIDKKKVSDSELSKKNSEIITRYKEIDSKFIPKIKSINKSKLENKQEYINSITELNRSKVNNKRNYDKVADEFSQRTEANNKRIEKIIAHYEKRHSDQSNNTSEVLAELVERIENEYQELIETVNKKIAENEKEKMTSTAKLNVDITELTKSFDTRKKYGYIPYNLEENHLRDDFSRAQDEYQNIENNILDAFKARLQENDEKIEELKAELKKRENEYHQKVNHLHSSYNLNIRKMTLQYDKDIAHAYKQYNKTKDRQYLIEYKRKINEKKRALSSSRKNHLKEVKNNKKEYIAFETEYIYKFEALRVQKLNYETTKSTATKNLNSEIESFTQDNNSKLALLSKLRDSFVQLENVDESKLVYKMRLHEDIDELGINTNIRYLERDIRELNYQKKYKIDKETLATKLKLDLLDADLKYNIENMKNTIEYNDVKSMLEIEKNKVLLDYNTDVISIKEEQATNTLNFLNKIDNLQYEIYKIDSSLETKKLDSELAYNKKIHQINYELIETEIKGDIQIANATASLKEGLANANLYQKRFSNEALILTHLFNLYMDCIKETNEMEISFISAFNNFTEFDFYEFNTPMMELMDLSKNLKQDFTDDFYTNQCNIINTRLSFQKDVKYSKQYDIVSLNEKQSLEVVYSQKTKIQETIKNYQNGIKIFENKIDEISLHMDELHLIMKQTKHKNPEEYNMSRKEYLSLASSLRRYEIMIEENLKSIEELNDKIKVLDNEIKKRQYDFKLKFDRIRSNQSSEAKVYYDALENIQWNYNEIKRFLFNIRKKYDFYHIGYDNLKFMCSKMEQENASFAKIMTIKYKIASDNFISEVNKQDMSKENHVRNLYSNEVKQIMKETSDTVNLLNNKSEITSRKFQNDIIILDNQKSNRQAQILKEIKELTNKNTIDNANYQDLITTKRELLSDSLISISTNLIDYEKMNAEREKNLKFENQYSHQTLEHKYRESLDSLDKKKHLFAISDRNQRKNIRVLFDNTQKDLNEEYKKNIAKSNNTISTIKKNEKYLNNQADINKEKSIYNLSIILKNNRLEYVSQLQVNEKYSNNRIKQQLKDLKNNTK